VRYAHELIKPSSLNITRVVAVAENVDEMVVVLELLTPPEDVAAIYEE
jgi:hypothetical protein